MGRRGRKRSKNTSVAADATEYTDADGNVLTLRNRLSWGARREVASLTGSTAATRDDVWQRQGELLFERLVVSWTIAGLPLTGQKELLGRYRMAGQAEREWVRRTLDEHLRTRVESR